MAISPDTPGQGAPGNSPPSSLSTALTAQQQQSQQSQQSISHPSNAPAPSLVRRSSFEPMRLGLSSLPPPVFSRGPPGQRSVPAIEFLNKENGLTPMSSTSASTGAILGGAMGNSAAMGQSGVVALPAVLGSGATTPAAGLGNGSMTSEPWNLWSDPTAPAADGASKANPANELSSSTGQANTTNVDSELASALAAAVVLDKNADKRSSIASRISNSSAGGGGEKGTAATSWPEGLANDNGKALQPQNFALGINASPERVRDGPGSDLGVGSKSPSSLLPRNVSFSSLLDLPQPENSSSSSTTTLDRKGSLTRRITSNNQNQPTAMGSTGSPTSNSNTLPGSTLITTTGATINANNSDSLSLPSLAFSASSPGVPSTYPVTSPATSVGSTLRQGSVTGLTSPSQSKHAPNFGGDPYGASRLRQTTNSTTGTGSSEYSSNPSTVSFGLGSAGRGLGIGGFANDGVFGPAPNDNAGPGGLLGGNNNAFTPRRDSGYGPSIYNNSPGIGFGPLGGDRRDSRSASWQVGGQYGMSRGVAPYSYNPTPPPNPYNSPFNLGLPSMDGGGSGGSSFMSLSSTTGSSPNSSSQPSLLRYPTLNNGAGLGNGLDFLLPHHQQQGGAGGLSNYGMAFSTAPPLMGSHAASSPYMRFGPPSGGLDGRAYPGAGAGAGGPYLLGGDYDRPRVYEEKSRPVRSPLLEEFRADKVRRWAVRDMRGYIAEFMCDQVGSRYLQESILEHPTSEDCDLLFEEVQGPILHLSTDVFANFCVQKLFEKASTEQIAVMAENLKGNILKLSLQTYGCRVVQKALEVVSPEHQVMILRELEGTVQKCVKDQNANHVIQKIVTTCPPDLLSFVVEAFVGHIYNFATHPYSCRVLQRILENCPERMTRPLLQELKTYALNLMQDQYGNYVIQFCLERGLPHDKSDIIMQIHGQVLHFSKHKFASNVIEKCIMNANEHELQMIAAEVLAPGMDGTTGIQAMLRHEYANYPLQRLIRHTTGALHLAIVDQVSMQLAIFRDSNPPFTAKHLVAVEKLLVDLAPTDFPGLMRRRFEDHYVARAR